MSLLFYYYYYIQQYRKYLILNNFLSHVSPLSMSHRVKYAVRLVSCFFFFLCFRCHIITQFNQGFYDYIIATDELNLSDPTAAPQTSAGKGKKKKSAEKAGKWVKAFLYWVRNSLHILMFNSLSFTYKRLWYI